VADLLRHCAELERKYNDMIRNADKDIWMAIESSPNLPENMATVHLYCTAHALYWQIQAMKGDPRATLHHPV
jgi:hypothetical protein